MLQIIGWILCLLLLAKSFEFFTSKNYKNEENDTTIGAGIGGLVTALGAVVFAWMLFNQGRPESSYLSVPDEINVDALSVDNLVLNDTSAVDSATEAASAREADEADEAIKNLERAADEIE